MIPAAAETTWQPALPNPKRPLSPWCLEKFPNFPRNEPPNPAKYFSERPEMTTQ